MENRLKFYIDGAWVDPAVARFAPVINPATEDRMYDVALASKADVDKAASAARAAFESYAQTEPAERVALLERIVTIYRGRMKDLAKAVSDEMGSPIGFAERFQAGIGLAHLTTALEILKTYRFEETSGRALIVREPVGVVAMITPWNLPLNQIACKVAPALATGCTMVLKPSELTPSSAVLFAEILHEAGVPKGVFNLLNGRGEDVGGALSEHGDVDMVSFTGSTRAGIDVARRAAASVKRVSQELGGKSPNLILEDADLAAAVSGGVAQAFYNAGQMCNAPTRMIVPKSRMDEAAAVAKAVAEGMRPGDPAASETSLGPVVSQTQWDRIQQYIQTGIDEGATLVAGGLGRPAGLSKGFYVRPTVFADVTNSMTIAREEIFGPVVAIIAAENEAEAVQIANDTPYGLAGYVSAGSTERAQAVARKLRAGNVNLNGVQNDISAPFGGYKQSGNGREWGKHGFEEYLEVKAIAGAAAS